MIILPLPSPAARAWKAFVDALKLAWSRLTGTLPADPQLLAARMVQIGIRRMMGITEQNGARYSKKPVDAFDQAQKHESGAQGHG